MKLSLTQRMCWYFVAWFVWTGILVWMAIQHSQSQMAVDPSSMAWTGFLPFLLPLFFVWSAYYLVPAIVIAEVVLWFVRK